MCLQSSCSHDRGEELKGRQKRHEGVKEARGEKGEDPSMAKSRFRDVAA